MQITSQTNNTNLSFQKFIKIKGPAKDLKIFRTELRENNKKNFLNFIINKNNKKSCLYLFTGKDKSSHINQNYINNLFKNHLRSFDFYSDDIRFHNLRDTYATMMLRNGCNIFTLKKLLGHNSFSSTARYIKCDTSDLEEAPAISHEWGFSL